MMKYTLFYCNGKQFGGGAVGPTIWGLTRAAPNTTNDTTRRHMPLRLKHIRREVDFKHIIIFVNEFDSAVELIGCSHLSLNQKSNISRIPLYKLTLKIVTPDCLCVLFFAQPNGQEGILQYRVFLKSNFVEFICVHAILESKSFLTVNIYLATTNNTNIE